MSSQVAGANKGGAKTSRAKRKLLEGLPMLSRPAKLLYLKNKLKISQKATLTS